VPAWRQRAVHRQRAEHVSTGTAARGGAHEPDRVPVAGPGRGFALRPEGRGRRGCALARAASPGRVPAGRLGCDCAARAPAQPRAGGRDRGAARRARELQRARARAARMADAAGGRSRVALELLPPAIGRRGRVRATWRGVTAGCALAGFSAADPAAGGYLLELGDNLHAARLGAVVALLRREAHLGADREALEVVVQHAVAVEVDLAVVAQLA